MISQVSSININTTSFAGHKKNTVPVTQAHIDLLSGGMHGGFIEKLDNMGLINRPMLQRVKKAAQAREAQDLDKSVASVFDIVKHPRYLVEQKDNGYWFETESKYDYRETVQHYADGQKYSTPVFSREREYANALEYIAQKGRPEDLKALEKLSKQMAGMKPILDNVEVLKSINKTTPLHFCIPQEGAYGKLVPFTRQSAVKFVSDTLYTPLKQTLEKLSSTAVKGLRK